MPRVWHAITSQCRCCKFEQGRIGRRQGLQFAAFSFIALDHTVQETVRKGMIDDMSEPNPATGPKRPGRPWLRIALVAAFYAALLALGFWGSGWLTDALGLKPGSDGVIVNKGAIWVGIALYALLLAIPFVPGIEVSLGLLATFGSAVAFQVYLGTVAAFVLAYAIGRLVPPALLSRFFRLIGLTSADALVERLRPLSQKERLALFVDQAPRRFVPVLLRYRYIALIIALNLPGNAILGGGGGIALVAGVSGMFSFPMYLAATSVAALPIPLAALLIGPIS